MKVLVTGGAGFIGGHVAEALLAAGHEVVVVDNLHTGVRENVPEGAAFYPIDICDHAAIAEIFARERIEAVSHQAALASVRESMADPIRYAEVNVVASLNLLELARKHQCRRFVFASSGGAVYGEGDSEAGDRLPFTENSPAQPMDNYGANKLSIEIHLGLYHANYQLPYAALRYANVYGPRQSGAGEAGVVAIFANAMIDNAPTRISGDGEQTRDFVYVGDVARANVRALESDAVGVFNLGTEVATSINTLHRIMATLAGYTQTPTYTPRPVGEVRATRVDCRKAGAQLNWQAEVSLEEGLRRTLEWVRSRRTSRTE
jgi:UDP-glucose 4-epimerase